MGAVASGRVAPDQTGPDEMDDAADDLAVIDPGDAAHLVGKQIQRIRPSGELSVG